MQTRRDQLQAYRFQNRRALAALVTGRPNVLEPPMRRLTVTTLSGIMIAVLIAIGFGVVALIRPSAGDSWKAAGAVIVDQDNNSTYVYTNGVLHPVLNYTSAVLAVSGTNSVSRVQVSSSDIANANYGYEIGIASIPYALPPQNSLISYPMSVCSVAQRTNTGGATAQVSLHIGNTGASSPVPSSQALLVEAAGGSSQPYLLYAGRRLAVGSQQIQSTLGLNAQPVPVGTAFLDSVPLGPSLAAPHIPGALTAQTSYSIAGAPRTIGTLLQVSGTKTEYIALPAGTRLLTPLEADLFVGYPTMSVSIQDATAQTVTVGSSGDLLGSLRQLPPNPPAIASNAGSRAGICVVYTQGGTASFALTNAALPTFLAGSVGQSDVSLSGRADAVDVPATKGLLATPSNAPNTVLFISDQGIKYAFANNSLLAGFGYDPGNVVKVPPALLTLIASGPALSTAAATARVAN